MDAKKLVQRIKEEKKQEKVMINVRVEEDLRQALIAFSKENGVSIKDVIETLLKDLLQPQKAKK